MRSMTTSTGVEEPLVMTIDPVEERGAMSKLGTVAPDPVQFRSLVATPPLGVTDRNPDDVVSVAVTLMTADLAPAGTPEVPAT